MLDDLRLHNALVSRQRRAHYEYEALKVLIEVAAALDEVFRDSDALGIRALVTDTGENLDATVEVVFLTDETRIS